MRSISSPSEATSRNSSASDRRAEASDSNASRASAGLSPNHRFAGIEEAATALLAGAAEGSVNVRRYAPEDARSREFIYD